MHLNLCILLIAVVIVCVVIATSVTGSSKSSMISDAPDNNLRESGYSNNSRSLDRGISDDVKVAISVSGNNNNSNRKNGNGGSKSRNNKNRSQKKGRGKNGGSKKGNNNRGGSKRSQRQKAYRNDLRLLSRNADNIEGGGAFPPLANIAPRALASVNGTCGLNGHEEYCKLVDAHPHNSWPEQCGICDANSLDLNKRHPIETVLNSTNSWWQSSTLQYGSDNEFITITVDLRQPYQIFYIMLKSAITPRPASWILERSQDNVTYEPWQYFGLSDLDCRRRYGIPGQNGKYEFETDTEVICTTQFSKPMPLENGEIHISLLKNRPGTIDQPAELMDFITARYVRFRFQGMHSTANSDNSVGWVLDAESLRKRSFYSLKLMRISGRLNCNGHAEKTEEVKDDDGEIRLQCVCLHNTCGRYCDQCCPFYNDGPFRPGTSRTDNICKACECNGHAGICSYDEKSPGGICQNCTDFTTGRNCEKCMEGYYRAPEVSPESVEPCLECNCHPAGSEGHCNPETGICVCRQGFIGPHCDECMAGFKGSSCERCSCDSRGVQQGGECDDPCQCKQHADGEVCSTCRPGYFGLRSDNPEGCLKCYCSGLGVVCKSYTMEMTSFETLDAWKVTDITKSIVAYPTRDNETGNLVYVMYELSEVEAVYWLAPRTYTGNLLTSYGSRLVVKTNWVVIRGDTSGQPTSGPNIILIGRNGAKIAYADETFTETSATIDIPLIETGWYHIPKTVKDIVMRLRRTEYRGDPVTRMQFMAVLTDVETVMIRGTFHTDQVESILERATLYSGWSEMIETESSLIEECQCPPGYSGLSCESCNFGYVRIFENSTTHDIVGKCIACGCNGHAESCNLQSGECGECIHNTFGERCERCKMGYYGNAMHGTPLDCKPCACPLIDGSNNFSPSCQLKRLSLDTNQYEFDDDEDYVCTQCPDGYIGDHCELCDDGYYGNPLTLGSKCLPCPCNGGPCDPITGECITCLGNTEGWRCERCQTGFWGDPSIVCEPCGCSTRGSESTVCNPETGQCTCNEHFSGLKCDECERGFTKLNTGICVECECNVNGSVNMWCDPNNGQCVCKFGVNGLKCDNCQEEFYGLTASGCEEKMSIIEQKSIIRGDIARIVRPGSYQQVRKRKCRIWIFEKFVPVIVSILVLSVFLNSVNANQSKLSVPSSVVTRSESVSSNSTRSSDPLNEGSKSASFRDDRRSSSYERFLAASANNRQTTTDLLAAGNSKNDSTTKNKLLRDVKSRNHRHHDRNRDKSRASNPNRKRKSRRKIVRIGDTRNTTRRDPFGSSTRSSVDTAPKISFSRIPGKFLKNTTSTVGGDHSSVDLNDVNLQYYGDPFINSTTVKKRRTKQGQLLIREDEGYVVYKNYRGLAPCPPGYPMYRECRCTNLGSTGAICNQISGQCNCLPNVVGQQCNICQAGYWNLIAGIGCQKCDCHPLGSIDNICDTVTGRCVCKQGVGGNKCDRCFDGFYGLSVNGCRPCDRCRSQGYICDTVTGSCICPANTMGTDCQHCQINTWNWQARTGCEKCDCDTQGSIGQSCDVLSGQCICREGYTGRRCDSCAVGYFGYPDCKRCNCNIHGSQVRSDGLIQCDYQGQCPCKELVTGLKCDSCQKHTFGLHKSNSLGCTHCLCFYRSQECTQSDLSWGLIRMQGARNLSVEYVKQESVPVGEYEYVVLIQMEGSEAYEEDAEIQTMNNLNLIPSSTGNVSIGAYSVFYVPLYFQLPPQFYGDRTKSYGGYLRFSILAVEAHRSMVYEVLRQFPLVQIHAYNKLVLDYYEPEPIKVLLNQTYAIRLHESFWRLHESNEQNVSRAIMMTALQNVRHIFLRATTWSDFTEIVLHSVQMDSAIYLSGSTTNLAFGIEQCRCPNKYDGLSCQDPASGYYRVRNNSSTDIEDIIGRAVPCNCHGRADICDKETGVCLNCRKNSGGEHCERCAEGFYGDPNFSECKPCPCPETNRNYAKGCSVWKGKVHCICKPGYIGALCDTCAKGYFGLPSESEGKCEACNCNLDGIVSDECDEETGQCNCRPGVVGRKCDRCTMERHILEDRRCRLCDNCTLILMDTIENIGNQLKRGIKHIDLTSITAPYSMIDDLKKSYEILKNRLSDSRLAEKEVRDYDEKNKNLLSQSEDLRIQSRRQKDNSKKSQMHAQNIRDEAKDHLKGADDLSKEAREIINELNNYGSDPRHTDAEEALKEAIPILKELEDHQADRRGYEEKQKCAYDLFNYFAPTSDRVQDQLVAMEKLSRNMQLFNNRLSDMIMKTDKTFEVMDDTQDIAEHIANYRKSTIERYGLIGEGEDEIVKLLNNSFITDADSKLGMIDSNLSNLKDDIKNIKELNKKVGAKLTGTEEELRNIHKHWIPKAEGHANELKRRAEEYAEKFQSTKDGAKLALMASTAYQNIIDAIERARNASKVAKISANLAEKKLFPSDGMSVTEKARKSIEYSKLLITRASNELRKINELLDKLRKNINDVVKIESTIKQAGIENNNIVLGLEKLNHHTKTVDEYRRLHDQSASYSKDMKDISRKDSIYRRNIKELRAKFATLDPDWASKLGLAEENVDNIRSSIHKADNSLTRVELEAERKNLEFRRANDTLAQKLRELKDKIAKAKHAAEGIKVSLGNLGKNCTRSYAPLSYGLFMSNMIKVKLALTEDINNSPIVFIGGNGTQFMALEMIKKQIRLIWNLGGRTGVLVHPEKLSVRDLKEDEAWYQIDVNRTLNIGSLLVRRMTNSSTLREVDPAVTIATDFDHTRFLVTASDHIWVGGVPDSLRPKEMQANPGLNVVLHQIDIDRKQLGLWNFFRNDGECGGMLSGPIEATPNSNTRYFNGEGYAELKPSRRPFRMNRFSIQMAFRTFDENALLFLAVDNKNNRSISITLNEGRIVFRIDYGKESKLEIVTTKNYNTGKEIRLEAGREFVKTGHTENGGLKVNTEEYLNAAPTSPITSSMLPDLSKGSYYLGGVPPGFRSGITKAPGADYPFMGCMMDVQINGESYDPLEGLAYFGIEQSCQTAIKKAGFYGKGFLELPSESLGKRASIGFVFRTLQPDCLLLLSAYPPSIADEYDVKDLKGNYSISLMDGKVQVWLQTGRDQLQLSSKQVVNDGEYHVLNLVKAKGNVKLMIDDELQWSGNLTGEISMPGDQGGLYFGGAPEYESYMPLSPTFTALEGCIQDIVFNKKSLLLSDTIGFKNVEIGRSGPEMGKPIGSGGDVLMKTEPIGKSFTENPEGCKRVGSYSYEPNAFKFGDGPFSHSQLNITVRNFWQKNFLIKFDFRTFYSTGVIFVAPGTKVKQKHFVALLLKDGQLLLRVRGRKKVELLLAAKLDDGQWHQVTISCQDRKVTMSVEIGETGQRTSTQMKIPRRVSASNNMFVGGLPEKGVNLPIEIEGYKGCIRKMTINNSTKDLARPGKHFNVGQCFPRVERGSYFPGDAYATYKKNFHVARYLEIELDFRTSELNGVFLTVSEPSGFPALSLELHNGNIVFSVDLGDGNPFRVESHYPSKYALCDNKWHNISAFYESEQIGLRIDQHPAIISMAQNRIVQRVQTKSSLYIGGLPDIAPSGTLLSRENFKGCIRNVGIRGERRDWTEMDSLHNVLLSECLAVDN